MGQKTDTLERDKTETSSKNYGGSSDTPPTWSELAEKSDTKNATKNTLLMTGAALAFNVFLPIPGGILTTVLIVTALSSALGFGDAKSGALAGATVGGVTAFLGSIIASILTLGLFTVFPAVIIGGVIGAVGGFVGSKLT